MDIGLSVEVYILYEMSLSLMQKEPKYKCCSLNCAVKNTYYYDMSFTQNCQGIPIVEVF